MTETAVLQREPGGLTYDRFRLGIIFSRITERYGVRRAIEVPAHGEKAMPSIYSLGLAMAGCEVTLVNPVEASLAEWERLGVRELARVVTADELTALPVDDGAYDLAWNFVTLSKTGEFDAVLAEMKRVTNQLVMTVHNNGFNLGYPWHRFLHRVLDLPWTHGDTRYHWPHQVRAAYRRLGMHERELDVFDAPPWPDPPGFRDVRLHRELAGGGDVDSCDWEAPVVEYYERGAFPAWMRALSVIEDLPGPRWMRYPFSHLFYALYSVA